jgi:transcriptional regulator with XRE-family HTH domain
MNMKRLGEAIRNRRLELKLTQEELAQKVTITQGYLTRLETGRQLPSHDLLIDIASELRVKSGDLFQLLDDKQDGVGPENIEIQQVLESGKGIVIIDGVDSGTIMALNQWLTNAIQSGQAVVLINDSGKLSKAVIKATRLGNQVVDLGQPGKVTAQDIEDTFASLPTKEEMKETQAMLDQMAQKQRGRKKETKT